MEGSRLEMKNSKGEWLLAEVAKFVGEEEDQVKVTFIGQVDEQTGKARGKVRNSFGMCER